VSAGLDYLSSQDRLSARPSTLCSSRCHVCGFLLLDERHAC
jgi:hypothetical protein